MSRRGSSPPKNRSAKDPTNLGVFDSLSLRVLKGELKQFHRLNGYADTNFNSNGGYGGGGYNAWFQVTLATKAWIMLVKGGRAKYLQLSVYNQNLVPQEGRMIFDRDEPPVQEVPIIATEVFPNQPIRTRSVIQQNFLDIYGEQINSNNTYDYYPYFGTVMAAGSDLYNRYEAWRLDKGDERYFPLNPGKYLICLSSTRNEPLEYEVGLVIEPPDDEVYLICEDVLVVNFALEDTLRTASSIEIPNYVDLDITIPSGFNAFTETFCQVNTPATVEIPSGSTWLIDTQNRLGADKGVILGEWTDGFFDTFHDHSLEQWTAAYQRDHRPNDALPTLFFPLLNRR